MLHHIPIAPSSVKPLTSSRGSSPLEVYRKSSSRRALLTTSLNNHLAEAQPLIPSYKRLDTLTINIDLLPDACCVIDSKGQVISKNSQFLELFPGEDSLQLYALCNIENTEPFTNALLEIFSQPDEETVVIRIGTDKAHLNLEWIVSGNSRMTLVTARDNSTSLQRIEELKDIIASFEDMMEAFAINSEEHYTRTRSDMKLKIDISEEQARTAALASTLETKRRLVRTVSHEMRTPLNVVTSGLLYLARECKDCSASIVESISDMIKSCDVAVEILGELLTYEKLEGGVQQLEVEEVPFNTLTKRAIELFRPQINAKHISVIHSVNYRVEEHQLELIVSADITKLNQVLRNILSNAIKFSPEGSTIHTKTMVFPPSSIQENKTWIRFEVRDNGPGISAENQKMLFREIVQFKPNELQGGGGSGLGLWISKGIMDLHKGRIGVRSRGEGKGTSFYIELEVVNDDQYMLDKVISTTLIGQAELVKMPCDQAISKATEESRHTSSPTISDTKKQFRLLIVDDSSLSRKMAVRYLAPYFGDITEAVDGLDALVKINQSQDSCASFDLILMDSQMPKITGYLAASIIRVMGFKGIIFGLTGNGSEEDIKSFLGQGVDKVLVKPLDTRSVEVICSSLGILFV